MGAKYFSEQQEKNIYTFSLKPDNIAVDIIMSAENASVFDNKIYINRSLAMPVAESKEDVCSYMAFSKCMVPSQDRVFYFQWQKHWVVGLSSVTVEAVDYF